MKKLILGIFLTTLSTSLFAQQQNQCNLAFSDISSKEEYFSTYSVPIFTKGQKTVFGKIERIAGNYYLVLQTFLQPKEFPSNQTLLDQENYMRFHRNKKVLVADWVEREQDNSVLKLYYNLSREDLENLKNDRFYSFNIQSIGFKRGYKDIKRHNKDLLNTYVECSLLM